MTNFEKTTLTEKGINLLAKQGTQIEFVGIETGCGIYVPGEDVTVLNAVKDKVQSFQITSVVRKNDRAIAIKFILANAGLQEDYRLTEIGLYANDPEEGKILYAICCSTPDSADIFRKYNGVFVYTTTVVLNVQVNHGAKIIIHPEGQYALAEDLQALKEEQPDWEEKDETSHAFIRNKPKIGGGSYVGVSPPDDTELIWIDISIGGVAKYYDAESEEWKAVLSVWA